MRVSGLALVFLALVHFALTHIVTDVADNSLAAAQGIEREDVITEVDNRPVTNVATFREALQKADPRKGILLYLDRKGSKTFAVLQQGGPQAQ